MPPLKSVAMAPGATVLTANPRPPQFLRQIARQHLDGALHRRIGRALRELDAGEPARNVHDVAAIVKRQELLCQEEVALEVNVTRLN